MRDVEQILTRSPVIPVIVIEDIADAVPLARALYQGGLQVLEVTLRTEQGLAAITEMRSALPDAIIGAGTVISGDDVVRSKAAGAEFLVSPGCTPALFDSAMAEQMPFLPGVNSPSEAMALLEKGQRHLKFFPAEAAGGVAMLKSIGGPLPQLRFCPTGGINLSNAKSYMALSNVACVGGSWMLDAKAIASKDWGLIEKLASEAAALKS
ncbi:bifunctional 4-hydroxy-2-oxoglutarate aldolase/2-dehydro-3-deoxy-phosphogluconate aldolase [Spongiibacter sp. KMU-158]|uniref:2-dehydro-3-deoxy-phosphogluconate aldolase n=1 Tax=Spongiibacter pelagi TaxID=2760804 RepID=A0A927C551_9GAMM|nr:bifunctional 4-hydroxy-2-oxoglutarate aldolase/2-dehydro-3-deoxy-phosphogluconate aldolase [Spongiibacter pelagi]MBD2859600.1 bifunctional 4-hydroxy-2-oxoglutarate aldolase/2-dehydro-3-deoxy-phosphogluconate aldolase [Spongiibacter pelagi]